MDTFDVYWFVTGIPILKEVMLESAAAAVDCDPEMIEFCMEEYGRCDYESYTVLPHGAEWMPFERWVELQDAS